MGAGAAGLDHADLVRHHGRAIAALVGQDPDAAVPGCADWTLRDLAGHVGAVIDTWVEVLTAGGDIDSPIGYVRVPDAEMADMIMQRLEVLDAHLRREDIATTPAWTWWGDRTARLIPRRIAHEMAVHHLDCLHALGRDERLPVDLAADGVREFYEVIIHLTPRVPGDLQGTVRLDLEDAGTSVDLVLPGERLPQWVDPAADGPPPRPDAVLAGPACDVLLALWRRPAARGLSTSGDADLVERLLALPYLGRSPKPEKPDL